jgi:hypothetical protein
VGVSLTGKFLNQPKRGQVSEQANYEKIININRNGAGIAFHLCAIRKSD